MKDAPSPTGAPPFPLPWSMNIAREAWDYWVDACQRAPLLLDVLRRRGQAYRQHNEKTAPHVLKFNYCVVMDGRQLPRPVNYILVRIVPPHQQRTDSRKRPFVVIDPRAGHGPGIGGFKAHSEIGVALNAGHPCYFVGFLPEPTAEQTIEDIASAQAAFLERVIALHPEAEGRPAVIGNCQAGWAVMMLAAMRPDLFGPIIVAGSPLSYWAGVQGQNPMRYTGGLLGGSWLTALLGDLGNGKFDGAWLVTNFENLNPSNTYFTKHYNLYRKIDTEAPRYLEFEQWWGGHVLLNAREMQFIVDELFIGNKLSSTELTARDGSRVDLRKIRSPILVFCSKADNITPPQQALNWILDLYEDVDDIRAHGQTIVYSLHGSIGHLGIFVSSSVAKKEHDEFSGNIDLIDVLPPGLYEAIIAPNDAAGPSTDYIGGEYLMRFETRTLDDIRALGSNSEEEDRKFEAVSRLSDINLGIYQTCLQPWVRAWANEGLADWGRRMHPLRLQYEVFANPVMSSLIASSVSSLSVRCPVASSNLFWQLQEEWARQIERGLDTYRDLRDHMAEAWFHAVYGSPLVQAMVGLRAPDRGTPRRPSRDPLYYAAVARRIQDLKAGMGKGGAREGLVRALLHIRMADGLFDERGFNFLRRMREDSGDGLTLGEFKDLVREQFLTLLLDEDRAVAAIPSMLAKDRELTARLAPKLHQLLDMAELRTDEAKARLREIKELIEETKLARREKRAMPSVDATSHGTEIPKH